MCSFSNVVIYNIFPGFDALSNFKLPTYVIWHILLGQQLLFIEVKVIKDQNPNEFLDVISKHANSVSILQLFQPQFRRGMTSQILDKLEGGDIFSYEIPENLLGPAGNQSCQVSKLLWVKPSLRC